jgi:uncharacterized glyoxalase superfamily protein PhnB
MATSWVPAGHNQVSPYLIVPGAPGLIEFLTTVFEGEELGRHGPPGGAIMHAEVKIGDSVIMLADSNDQFAPRPGMLNVYVADVDAAYRRALAAGATSEREPADQFYGDRSAGVKDRWGNVWWIATHIEDVSDEELARRAQNQH